MARQPGKKGASGVLASVGEAAKHLLANRPRHGTEGNVQSDVEALLRAIGVGTIESQYQTGEGPADLYLPNRRCFIECKGYPAAKDPDKPQARKESESPREQLDRYVRAQIASETRTLPIFESETQLAMPWTGIVTDGTHWHVYRYAHELPAAGDRESSKTFVNENDALAAYVAETLGRDMVGKEWIPEAPGELFSDLKDDLDGLYEDLPKRARAPTDTKWKLWLDMMRTSGMVPREAPDQRRLFLAHSFLILVVRLVSHTLRGRKGEDLSEALRDGFASWVLDFERGRKWARKAWGRVDGYDWRQGANRLPARLTSVVALGFSTAAKWLAKALYRASSYTRWTRYGPAWHATSPPVSRNWAASITRRIPRYATTLPRYASNEKLKGPPTIRVSSSSR